MKILRPVIPSLEEKQSVGGMEYIGESLGLRFLLRENQYTIVMKDAEVMEDTENCESLLRENQHTTVMKYMEAGRKTPAIMHLVLYFSEIWI